MRENWELLTKIDAIEDDEPELSEQQFELISDFSPEGDQPQAIDQLTEGLQRGDKSQTLLGVTGSGKTYTMANVIQNVQLPTLVISPNKTLAAQLYNEFRTFFQITPFTISSAIMNTINRKHIFRLLTLSLRRMSALTKKSRECGLLRQHP